MATNYMTVLESEISDIEPRLWRLKQAIDVPDPHFETSELADEIMRMRYETTLRLYRILLLQQEIFGMDKDEADKMLANFGSAERIIDVTEKEPDYKSVEEAYIHELDNLDETNRFIDSKWMSITRPQDSIWKDYPEPLKKRLLKEADALVRKTMGKRRYEKLNAKNVNDDSGMDYFERYEKSLSQHFQKDCVKKMVAEERKYYRDLDAWNRKGGRK